MSAMLRDVDALDRDGVDYNEPCQAGETGGSATVPELNSAVLRSELEALRTLLRNDMREEMTSALASAPSALVFPAKSSGSAFPPPLDSAKAMPHVNTFPLPDSQSRHGLNKRRLPALPGAIASDEVEDASDQVMDSTPTWLTQMTSTGNGNSLGGHESEERTNSMMASRSSTYTILNEGDSSGYKSKRSVSRLSVAGVHKVLSKGSKMSSKEKESKTELEETGSQIFLDKAAETMQIVVCFVIILNAICFGIQTQYMAVNCTETVPSFYVVLETIFCCVFSLELAIRIAQHKMSFFSCLERDWQWNMFDTFLVVTQLMDLTMEFLGSSATGTTDLGAMKNASFARMLRMLRLLRVLRCARLLKFMGDMNVVVSAIAGSMRSLFGTLMILVLMLYTIGIVFTQIVTTSRVSQMAESGTQDPELLFWWGGLASSIYTLYQAILGGVDWEDVVRPLITINPVLGLVFALYVAFVLLAMMNTITGIFVESACQNAKCMKDKAFEMHVRAFFKKVDQDDSGEISKHELAMCMDDSTIKQFTADLGIDIQDAGILFDLLDDDHSGTIDMEELLTGMVRLRAGAKFLDVMTLMRDLDAHTTKWTDWSDTASAKMTSLVHGVESLSNEIRSADGFRTKKSHRSTKNDEKTVADEIDIMDL